MRPWRRQERKEGKEKEKVGSLTIAVISGGHRGVRGGRGEEKSLIATSQNNFPSAHP